MVSDDLYRGHVSEAIRKIRTYMANITFAEFEKNLLVQDAVIREFEVIGEASKFLSEEFKERHGKIPWKQVASMRDRLVHEYFNVDTELVWETIERDLLSLERAMR